MILAAALLLISHAHSLRPLRGTLILAVVLLLVLSPGPLYAPLKWRLCQLRGLSLKLSLLLPVLLVQALNPIVPTQATILLNCSEPLTIIAYFE